MVSKQHKRYYNTGLLFAAKELVVRHYGGHDDLITELVASAHSSSFGGDSKDNGGRGQKSKEIANVNGH
jgi:hypothetical protein